MEIIINPNDSLQNIISNFQIELDSFIEQFNCNKIMVNCKIGAFLLDVQKFKPKQLNDIQLTMSGDPYIIGTYNDIDLYVNPFQKYSDTDIHLHLTDGRIETITVDDKSDMLL